MTSVNQNFMIMIKSYDFYLKVSPLKNETLRKLTPSRK